jgi:hypothetical protein
MPAATPSRFAVLNRLIPDSFTLALMGAMLAAPPDASSAMSPRSRSACCFSCTGPNCPVRR